MDVPDDLEVALNEATVAGLRASASGSVSELASEPSDTGRPRAAAPSLRGAVVSLLLHVLALPVAGPPDPDTRRALVFAPVSRVRVLLRRDEPGEVDYGPAVPLADLAAVEEFFASLTRSGDLYGWEFVDAPDLVADWPAEVSLDLRFGEPTAETHSLYWFNECGTAAGQFCIEGVVDFADVAVHRADGTRMPMADFIADGRRWWEAFRTNDPRVSPAAQRAQPPSPAWR